MKLCEYQPRLSYYVGGGELVVIEQIKRLSKNNEVVILTSKTKNPTEQFKELIKNYPVSVLFIENPLENFPIGAFENKKLNKWDLESLEFGEKAYSFLEQENFDLIVTHYSLDSLFIPKKTKNVLHLHGVPPEKKQIDQIAIVDKKNFVSVANFVTEGWNDLYSLGKIPTCYNGVDLKKFHNKNIQRDIDIIYIGRLVPYKRLDILVRALKNFKNLNIVIGGEGIEKEKLKKLAKKYNSKIKFIGYVPDDKIVEYYNRSKIFVHTANTREGVITTALEAMASGVIPVVSASCGMIEVVKDGKTGFTFEPLNVTDLSKKIKQALILKENTKIKEESKKIISKEFDCDKNTKKLEKIYKKIVGVKK